MKRFRIITMGILAMLLCMSFSSCSSDDEKSENGVAQPSMNRKIKYIKETFPLYGGSVYYDIFNPTWDGNTLISFIDGDGEEPGERDRMTIEYEDNNEALIFNGGSPSRFVLDENGHAKSTSFGYYII